MLLKCRAKRMFFVIAVLFLASCPALLAQNNNKQPPPKYTPPPPPPPRPAPTYTPPPAPRPTYTPPPSRPSTPTPSPSSNNYSRPAPAPNNNSARPATTTPATTPARTYTPGANTSTAPARTYTPGASTSTAPARTYTPGASTSTAPARTYTPGASTSSSSGVRTYTPGATTSSTPTHAIAASPGGVSSGVRTENGVTTYTPHAPATAGTPAGNSRPGTPSSSANSGVGAHPIYTVAGSEVAGRAPNGGSTLTPTGSHQVLQQVNTNRTNMSGINRNPIPQGRVSIEPNGHVAVAAANGREYNLRSNGTVAAIHTNSGTLTFRGDGHLASVRTPTLRVMHGPHGERTIIHRLPDNRVVVSAGRHFGYVQRTVAFRGTEFVQRTYVRGAMVQTAAFTNFSYRGVAMEHYVPNYTYAPAFYGWAYYGWNQPVAYAWGWAGDPCRCLFARRSRRACGRYGGRRFRTAG